MEQAARALIAKLDECEPHISTAFLLMQMKCGPYTGPNYGEELKALRAAVDGGADKPEPHSPS